MKTPNDEKFLQPPNLVVTIPSLSVYETLYVFTGTFQTDRGKVTVTSKLKQYTQDFVMWKWEDDRLEGERGGHLLRQGTKMWHIANRVVTRIRQDATASARMVGWYVDSEVGLWYAPVYVWRQSLYKIM